MHNDSGNPFRAARSIRGLAILMAFAIIGTMAIPLGPVAAQTDPAEGTGIVNLAPANSLIFAEANLDLESDQATLAAELFERAGLEEALAEEGFDDSEEIPANARVGVAVTSLPDASDLNVAEVSGDPLAATEALEEGGFAVIVGAEGIESSYQDELSSLDEDAQSGAGEIVESEYGGITITSFETAPGEEFADPSAVAMVGEYMVVAMRAEDIHPIIDTFNGDVENLTSNENYQALVGLLPTENLASGYIDGPALLAAIETQSPEALDVVGDQAIAMLDAWTGFTFSAEPEGFRLETRSISNGDAFGAMTPLDGAFFDSVPSGALFVTNGTNIDSTGVVTLLALAFASEFVGEDLTATPVADMDLAEAQDDIFARAESMLGFNIKTDLVDNLVGEFGLVLSLDNITAEVPEIDALIVSEVENPSVVQDVMSKIAFIVGAGLGDQTSVESRDVNGSTVNMIDLSATGTVDKVEFGVVDNEMVISVGDGLDDYVLGPDMPMSEDANFQSVMELMPAEYGSLTYVNMPVVLGLVTSFSDSVGASTTDADESCGDYATQEEAQTAYDEDQFENFMLDQDFDGEACEDYFALAAASPVAVENPYSNILGLAIATTQDEGVNGSTTFIRIGGE